MVYGHGAYEYPMEPGDSLLLDGGGPHGPLKLTPSPSPSQPSPPPNPLPLHASEHFLHFPSVGSAKTAHSRNHLAGLHTRGEQPRGGPGMKSRESVVIGQVPGQFLEHPADPFGTAVPADSRASSRDCPAATGTVWPLRASRTVTGAPGRDRHPSG